MIWVMNDINRIYECYLMSEYSIRAVQEQPKTVIKAKFAVK